MRLRLQLAAALILTLLPLAASAQDVAVYGAPGNSSWNTDVVNKLVATGQFDSVTGVMVSSSTPSLADMLNYDAILVYSDTSFNNGVLLGDRLADYMDAGGGVVVSTFAFYGTTQGLSLRGRIQTAGYLPFNGSSQSQGSPLTMSVLDPTHAILDGVTSFNGGSSSYRNNLTHKSGTDQIANWSNGVALIAAWSPPGSDGTIAGLNFYPPSQTARSDFWNTSTDGGLIMANALTFVGGGSPPVADAGGPYVVDEGSTPVLDGSATTDPNNDIVSYEWDCTDDGVYDVLTASPTTTGCTYGDQQTHTLRLKVTDATASVSEDTAVVTVVNVAPLMTAMTVPPGNENQPLTISATAYEIAEDTATFTWDLGDGSPARVGDTVTHTYLDDGAYTVSLVLTDEDGGVSAPSTATANIANLAPVIDSMVLEDGVEASPVTFTASASDVPADTVTLTWSFGDGSPAQTGTTVVQTYEDDGAFSVTLSATDEDGGLSTQIGTVNIGNIAPVLTGITVPGTATEGALLNFSATATDVSVPDALGLTFSWDWGDGTPTTVGQTPTHAFPDDGVFTITVEVEDDEGGLDFDTVSLTVDNVDPIIGSTAPTFALENQLYSYSPVATDPGDEVFLWSLLAGPASMTIDGATGQILWIPLYDDAITGTVTMTIAVDDGDGGAGTQTVLINVSTIDSDGDGMPDGWEEANDLDPEDPTDALTDPDGDGLNNVTEFQGGTDPNSFDGPTAPINLVPGDLQQTATLLPDLSFLNSTDPQNDLVDYDLQVHDNATLTSLVTEGVGFAEDASGTTTWPTDVELIENTWYWFQARGHDGTIHGDWSIPTSFFVNEIEEAPPVPTPIFPIDGEVLALPLSVAFAQWTDVLDPEGSEVTYHVRIWDGDGATIIGEGTALPQDDGGDDDDAGDDDDDDDSAPGDDDDDDSAGDDDDDSATGDDDDSAVAAFASESEERYDWIIDVPLVENTWYRWDVAAIDDLGNSSAYAEQEPFFFSTENEAPSGLAWIDPEDGGETTLTPTLVVSEAIDPEGTELQYRFELDLVDTFDSAAFLTRTVPGNGDGTASWDLEGSGDVLTEDVEIHGRVRATDADGVNSPWSIIAWTSRGENDPPSVPELVTPEDNTVWETDELPVFVINNSTDPEGDEITYDFALFADPEGLTLLGELIDVAEDPSGATSVGHPVEVELIGDVYWTARAVDAEGAASEWADSFLLRFPQSVGDDDDSAATGDDDDDGGEGCACGSSIAGSRGGVLAFLGLLGLAGTVRRRR